MSEGGLEPIASGPVSGEALDRGPVVVVTAVHLPAEARAALAEKLGPGHVVRDIREAGNTADIVLVPSMSGHGLGALRQMFPGAKLLAGEFVDDQYGVDIAGPMRRALDSGVDGYFLAPDLAAVAQVTRDAALGKPIGILEAGRPSTARAALANDGSSRREGTLHVVDSHDVQRVARELDAVAIDDAEWSERLGLSDLGQQRELTRLLSALARDLLSHGVDVVCGRPVTPSSGQAP